MVQNTSGSKAHGKIEMFWKNWQLLWLIQNLSTSEYKLAFENSKTHLNKEETNINIFKNIYFWAKLTLSSGFWGPDLHLLVTRICLLETMKSLFLQADLVCFPC